MYEKISSFRSPSSSPWSSSSRSWWLHVLMECSHKILLKSGLIVPCGKCPACLANSRSEWIFRLKEEAKNSVFCCFVTLTYDDEHIPKDFSVNKKHIQDFHKRLRKHFPSGDMRYYLVSEYGDHTFRPHYHGLYFFKHHYKLDFIYDIFLKSWQQGFIKFGEVEEGSIVYCTKYCLKHTTTPEGRTKTFRMISKMNEGGIGVSYLNKMKDYHVQQENFTRVFADGTKARMPRYYRDRINPYKGGFKYNPLHFRREQDYADDASNRLEQRFRQFIAERKFNNFEEARKSFFDYEHQVAKNRDDLLIKHCKKQKF